MRSLALAVALAAALTTTTALAAPSPHEQALDLFDKGRAAYNEGRFKESVELLTQAYSLEKVPVLLYNLGRSYEALGDFEKAASTYDDYLAQAGDIPDRAAIEARVANLRRTIDEKHKLARERDEALAAKAQGAAPVAPTHPATSKPSPSPVPWIIAGVGFAGLGVGAGLGGAALSKNAGAKDAPNQEQAASEHDAAKSLALGSTAALVAGGVVLAAGATWGIIDVVSKKSSKSSVQAWIEIRPAFVSTRVTF